MIIIEGKIVSGMGAAQHNLPIQMQYLMRDFPEIRNCYPGSINVELRKPLKIFNHDFESKPIPWVQGRNDIVETFGFTRIKFEILNSDNQLPVDAWIYDPYNSPHRLDPFYVEIITSRIELNNVKLCKVYLDKDYKEQPFIIV